MSDGVSLTSVNHPVAPWYQRWWFALRRPRLSPDSQKTVEIETFDPLLWNGIADYAVRRRAKRGGDLFNGAFNVDNKAVEQEIQDKGLTAPRVTLAGIESIIAYEWYAMGSTAFGQTRPIFGPASKEFDRADIVPLACLTFCVLQLKNGFMVTGESVCVSPENFDAALGRKIARQKAIDKIWMLEGYLLKERLHNDAAMVPRDDER